MQPKKYLYKMAQAVSKRSGISINTLLVALPAIFDEMRYTLCEGKYRCITIESFGVLSVKERPQRHYTRRFPDGHTENIDLPPKLVIKFSPSRNMRLEVEASKYDPTRQSFVLHPDDHPLRTRLKIEPKPKKKAFNIDDMALRGTVVKDGKGTTPTDNSINIVMGKPQGDPSNL